VLVVLVYITAPESGLAKVVVKLFKTVELLAKTSFMLEI